MSSDLDPTEPLVARDGHPVAVAPRRRPHWAWRALLILPVFAAGLLAAAAVRSAIATVPPSPSERPTPVATVSASPLASLTPTPAPRRSETAKPSPSSEPSATATPSASGTPKATPTSPPSATPGPTATLPASPTAKP